MTLFDKIVTTACGLTLLVACCKVCEMRTSSGSDGTPFQLRASSPLSQSRSLSLLKDPSTSEVKQHEQELEFVHISMTGGKAIEMVGYQEAGMYWGVCHILSIQAIGCEQPDWKMDWLGPGEDDDDHESKKSKKKQKKFNQEPWLAPPLWMHPNPYEGKKTFTVVRDPYDRVVREYAMFGAAFNVDNDPHDMNEWIQDTLKQVEQAESYPGHFLPQHYYVYGPDDEQVIDYVLRYENLNEEFFELMEKFNIMAALPQKHQIEPSVTFTKDMLSDATIKKINMLYNKDFTMLDYPMVETGKDFQKEE
mmetsp:Transcript_50353/g.75263  ORF Transcript_50353/g.75263 Transcript_50353/m.75263 type:complete len:306 (-) Transcript_50353:164-1081(-)|eukprot:CAMPEP_0194029460 /NCGR_PEP_ID=MMETSP0009_2-20130614/3170_1 /TAXON_ID=210454 /ORGANISM="Grammatophora oceanica, Strain CCMP 410" /LENGTH=305 /DNA_ID=CAMNT_0038669125 /DNA_START=91 /DNA_END=1008 /DNA_ORIENTATION=+